MKIGLIMADGRVHSLNVIWGKISFREAPLTLTTLAALVPKEFNAEIVLVDESVEPLDVRRFKGFDLVGVSTITGTAKRAYEIAVD